ncbi:hypothetical protein KKE03_05040 [Patescibacteria group bacterium]|nr:hypothetical protein [Patescibacteria group bacterium]
MNDILNTILKDTFSHTLLNHRVKLLKSNLLKTFFGGASPTLTPSDLNWLKSFPESFYRNFNKDNVYQIFSDLEQNYAKLPILTIYLAFEPDEATVANIGAFTRKTFGLPFMLDIKLDPRLIAGAALSWKGVYRDFSLRTRIEEKKEEISQSFKKFLRQ